MLANILLHFLSIHDFPDKDKVLLDYAKLRKINSQDKLPEIKGLLKILRKKSVLYARERQKIT